MKSSKTRYAILGALSMWPMTGYDIRKVLESGIGRFWSESYGQLYPELRRMSDQGQVRKSEEGGKGKPRRVLYSLTSKGREELLAWLVTPALPGTSREEILLKLFFGSQVDVRVSTGQLQRFREFHQECLRKCKRVEKGLSAGEKTPDSVYWIITLKYSESVSRALLEWCDEALSLLKG